jgi:outer membrane protein OmpA-like peptidoglycan-associated protein
VQPGSPPAPKSPTAPPAATRAQPGGAPQGVVAGPKRFDEVQKGRLQHVEDGGRRTVIQEPGNRVILKQDNRAIIRHDEAARFASRPDARTERRPDGATETFYVRSDGARIVTVVDAHGRLVRRYRRGPDGREHNLIDNRRFLRNLAIGVGVGAIGLAILNLPPPRITIPREKYFVDYERASDDDLYEALDAPPIENLERAYSLDEVRDNYELRMRMRHIELGNITFAFGAWEVAPDQYPRLERLARAILRVLRRNPDEVFLIEGHTDAVGSDVDNLSLSDRRAEAVAGILSDTFGVPPENLVTQGYGEQYLKINTQAAEPLNRRVEVLRITPLISER